MKDPRRYSSLFSCLYDEPGPIGAVGAIGRGTHYSVMRSIAWLSVERELMPRPQLHDFAVIWDEDHDTRVITAIERILMAGLLSTVSFIGERKGTLHLLLSEQLEFLWSPGDIEKYIRAVSDAVGEIDGDYWSVSVGFFDPMAINPGRNFPGGILFPSNGASITYLQNIANLWALGLKPWQDEEQLSAEP